MWYTLDRLLQDDMSGGVAGLAKFTMIVSKQMQKYENRTGQLTWFGLCGRRSLDLNAKRLLDG